MSPGNTFFAVLCCGLVAAVVALTTRLLRLQRAVDDRAAESITKARFLTTMSQEMRTPISGLIGMTSLLLSTSLEGDQQEYARHIQQSGEALLQQVNDLVDYARLDEGGLQLEEVDFDLHGLLEH